MDLSVRAMRLETAIKETPGIGCTIRFSEREKCTVVTVQIWGICPDGSIRDTTLDERHKVHEAMAAEFWSDRDTFSWQLTG